MNVIVAVNSDWGIGNNNGQSIVIPDDRRFFLKTTAGCAVIVGRKTFEVIGKPLPNRENIVLTRDKEYKSEGAAVAHSVGEVLTAVADRDPDKVFVIGGGDVYRMFLPHCSRAYVTQICAAPPSDTWFPNLDKMDGWRLFSREEPLEHNGTAYSFCQYVRV